MTVWSVFTQRKETTFSGTRRRNTSLKIEGNGNMGQIVIFSLSKIEVGKREKKRFIQYPRMKHKFSVAYLIS
ncbi:hypothetical protein MAR_028540 [Mya arenaria]|uniref:Uncharacterized protein n=1 Tax=Mya arenaria TaxID=6604 RepID=A0ABY7DGM8_MYAAR|nr:hypothetical protein MAR_028540 [Mya arenaria]